MTFLSNGLAVMEVWRSPHSNITIVEYGPIAKEREMGTPVMCIQAVSFTFTLNMPKQCECT